MRKKPWPILILAFLHIIEPLPKTLLYSYLAEVSPLVFITRDLATATPWQLFQFAALFPLAGFAILSVKKWSLPVFLLIQGFVLFSQISYYFENPDSMPLALMVAFHVLNLGAVLYFLLPAVRLAYLDPRMRWWESKPRYKVELATEYFLINSDGLQEETGHKGTILDLSEGGAFIETDPIFEMDQLVSIKFNVLRESFEFQAHVVHTGKANFKGFGLRFTFQNQEQLNQVKNLVTALKTLNPPRTSPFQAAVKDVIDGIMGIFQGKGMTPKTDSSDPSRPFK